MSLEQQLKQSAEAWLAEEVLPADKANLLVNLVRQQAGMNRNRFATRRLKLALGGVATAAAVFGGVLFGPVIVGMASGTPWVGPYIARMAKYDQGAYWADQKGYVVPVGKSVTANGYTFGVESIVADAARTEIYWVVEGPELQESSVSPTIETTFNLSHPNGGSSARWEIVDGKLTGSTTLPPLPTPTARVSFSLREIAGHKGDWSITFMASRAELDKLTRTIAVGQPLKTEGADLMVRQVILAPTETTVELEGTTAPGFTIRKLELLADGVPVPEHGAEYSIATQQDSKFSARWRFDRVDGEPASLTVRIADAIVWKEGGPSIELTPGNRTTYGDYWFEPVSVSAANGETTVRLRVPFTPEQNLTDWVLVGSEERRLAATDYAEYMPQGSIAPHPSGEGWQMELTFPGEMPDALRLEARLQAQMLSAPLEVQIPVRK